ncbi:MAG TPA: aldehyde dehydrogenase (NADP(+)) [Puia sp.]|nr:aldehyde dehydrogenase (NADP(+)) [Puia sp.]
MEVLPSQIIGYRHVQSKGEIFYGFNPGSGKPLSPEFREASLSEINESAVLANRAFALYRKTSALQRSLLLETIAGNIEALGDDLLKIINEETALPLTRLTGERSRTTGQLRLFAQLLREGNWNKEIVDEPLPDRKPVVRPGMIQIQVPIGVVAVFGASNFPLAFSVAGGDTAAALAAGCPVVFKAHPAHPATCQLIGEAIAKAAKETGMPDGTFSMLHGRSNEVGGTLVTHPLIKAVAFTGSFKGGKALYDLAVKRPEPIPVYAEMGSVNPVFFLPEAVRQGGESLALQFGQSVTLGSGQFCTNPGFCILINNEESKQFIQRLTDGLAATAVHPMLTKGIADAYKSGLQRQYNMSGDPIPAITAETEIRPGINTITAKSLMKNPDFFEEVFGPSTVAVLSDNYDEMFRLAEVMPGQLTGTIQAAENDYPIAQELIELLTQKVGRVIMNGFPTGVEVCHAMVHGGPYPATTDSRVTSVGTTSIYRFTRPVCYQNIPQSLLPVSNS